jgi:hypothetical protein
VDALLAAAAEGDLVLTLGAGNVWQAGEKVLERLRTVGQASRPVPPTSERPRGVGQASWPVPLNPERPRKGGPD